MAAVLSRVVARKVSRLRWRPRAGGSLGSSSLGSPTEFATGSWDAQHENSLCLWSLYEEDEEEGEGLGAEPRPLCETRHHGDVMDMQFVDEVSLLTSSSSGDVCFLRVEDGGASLRTHACVRVHDSVCSSVSASDAHAACVGEDGRLGFIDIATATVLHLYDADCTALHAVTHAAAATVLTTNSVGQLKQWDLRQAETGPSAIMAAPGCRRPLLCVSVHPSQPHVVATGGEDGTLYVWDARHPHAPAALLEGHAAEMWEVQFHPSSPDNLFTCSEDGALWHWRVGGGLALPVSRTGGHLQPPRSSSSAAVVGVSGGPGGGPAGGPAGGGPAGGWLGDPCSSGLLIESLLPPAGAPLNSLHAAGGRLLCGGDAERVYVCSGLALC